MFNTADGGKSADFPFKPGHYVAACSSGRWCQGAAACLPALVWLVPWQARLQTHLSHGVHVGLVSWSVAWVLHRCHGCQGECGGGGVSVYQPLLTSVHLSNHLVLFIITSGERENPDRKPCKDARRVSGSDGWCLGFCPCSSSAVRSAGLMFKHVGVPRRLIYAVLISAPTGKLIWAGQQGVSESWWWSCSCRLLSGLLCRKLNGWLYFFGFCRWNCAP